MSTASRAKRAAVASTDDDGFNGARERILRAATSFFQQHGYEGTSIAKIAKAAGMAPGNIYWHFPSKLHLLAEVLGSLYQDSYVRIEANVGGGSAPERLTAYVKAYVHMQLTELDDNCNFGYATLASSLSTEAQRELMTKGRPYLELLRDILRQGVDEDEFKVNDLTVTSYAISTMCEYVFTWFRSHGRLTIDEVCVQYADLALSMARGDRAV